MTPLRFHWSLSQVGDKFRRARATSEMAGLPDFPAQLEFCRRAEECGIDSVLMAIGFTRPDPLALSVALGLKTERIKFMIACRSGLITPTLFVQQINTASALISGRVQINMVMGHTPDELHFYGDFLTHDERCERTDEFLDICRAFWRQDGEVNFAGRYYRVERGKINTPFVSAERSAPEIFLGGNSEPTTRLAIKHASCLWRFADAPERLRPHVEEVVRHGVEVGLLVSLLVRPTREQSLRDASAMIETLSAQSRQAGKEFALKTDSVGFRSTLALAETGPSDWLTPCLWTGAIPFLGAPSIALVGSPKEIAAALMEYRRIGVTQFLFMGWPDLDEMTYFGREVLPLIRRRETEEAAAL
ncbi:MAG: alkanesulfonate monooxygenase [Acidobacteriota bacterium]|nr:alkanesulfonate monooxygenase [Acidobacteriota bacterium]